MSHPQRTYFQAVEIALAADSMWLDVGCGRRVVPEWLSDATAIEMRLRARAFLYGVDPDMSALKVNRACAHRVVSTAEALPFASSSFDLVTSNMVFEHIQRPVAVLREIRRVLRPGGRLIVHTPNIYDIVTIAARLLPNHWHPWIVRRIEGRPEEATYPTYFQFNRLGQILPILEGLDFADVRARYLEHPDVYQRLPVIRAIEKAWHRSARRWPALRGTLLVQAAIPANTQAGGGAAPSIHW